MTISLFPAFALTLFLGCGGSAKTAAPQVAHELDIEDAEPAYEEVEMWEEADPDDIDEDLTAVPPPTERGDEDADAVDTGGGGVE